ncbi:hypothetical protein BKA82DRAFT_3969393, partial [Pisolithus tinctorius]
LRYKNTSFVTPYLILAFHTDLSCAQNLLPLRGEITLSATMTNVESRRDVADHCLLNEVDVRLLAIGTPTYGKRKGVEAYDPAAEGLLKRFH